MVKINFQLSEDMPLFLLEKFLSKKLPFKNKKDQTKVKIQRFMSEELAIEKHLGIPRKSLKPEEIEQLFKKAYSKMEPQEKELFNIWQITLPYLDLSKKNYLQELAGSIKSSLPGVLFVCPERGYHLTQNPLSSLYPDHLQSLVKIQCVEAWNIEKNKGALAIVAIIDSGLVLDHPEIANNIAIDDLGNMITNVCLEGEPSPSINDIIGHGTHIAGIIAAADVDNIGITGIAPNAKIIPIKAFDSFKESMSKNIADALYFAESKGAHIINNSWFYDGDASNYGFLDDNDEDKALLKAVKFVLDKDVICVFAAGNDGEDITDYWLVREPDTIVVAATTIDDLQLGDSNWSEKITIAAPGDEITSLGKNKINYPKKSGTSMAAAHVSGAIALYVSLMGGLRIKPSKIIDRLHNHSDSITNTDIGGRRLNCKQLLS
jgi:thermitase